MANGTEIYFNKVAFAGKLWDYSIIALSNNGEFSEFRVYDSLDDYSNERKEAKEIYDSYKEVLDKKYSSSKYPTERKEDDGISSLYVGRNGVGMELYNRRSRSKGGTYRRFVGMEYSHMGILNRNQQAKESDL